jgi:leucyl/phenylalanyl-tRNA--protein transferase
MGFLPKYVSAVVPNHIKVTGKRLLQKSFHKGLSKVSGGDNDALLWSYAQFKLSPFLIIQAYMQGFYPFPNMENNKIIEWYDLDLRGVIPIQDFKARGDLYRFLKKEKLKEANPQFKIKINADFKAVILACAEPRGGKRQKTWLSTEYIEALLELHNMGLAHSVEAYENGVLVGGVMGLAINGYFSTLSLFHTVDNASKVAFYYLLTKLKDDGFKLHFTGTPDAWFSQYGMINVEKEIFRKDLLGAVTAQVAFTKNIPQLLF